MPPEVLEMCRRFVGRSPKAMVVVGTKHTIEYANAAFFGLCGATESDLIGHAFEEAAPEDMARECSENIDRILAGHGPLGTIDAEPDMKAMVVGQKPLSLSMWGLAVPDAEPVWVVIQVTDLTEMEIFRKQSAAMNEALLLSSVREHELRELAEGASQRLSTLAATDGLTGVQNHRAFGNRLCEEVERSRRTGEPLSIALLDVDCFKDFNDAHGHQAGDAALRAVASALVGTARQIDVVARYGGEEFAVILLGAPPDAAFEAAERLRRAIESIVPDRGAVTASFGVATLKDGMSEEDLIEAADKALYRSKDAGRNRTTSAI